MCAACSSQQDSSPASATKPVDSHSKADSSHPSDAKKHNDLEGQITPGDEPYSGPKASVTVAQRESYPVQYAANVNVTTPTGGWTFQLDRGEVVGDTARVYLTLEKPGPEQLVTQALVTHTQVYTSTTPFSRAAVYIHVAQQDISTFTANYRLAATSDSTSSD